MSDFAVATERTSGAPAGTVFSWRVVSAKGSALGLDLALCDSGSVLLEGRPYGSLRDVDEALDAIALHRGIDLAPVIVALQRRVQVERDRAHAAFAARAKGIL